MKNQITLLAIETSCDETAAAVLRGTLGSKKPEFSLLSSCLHSQISIHQKTGGVVPEVAARNHIQHIYPIVQQALKQANVALEKLDYIAVTSGPGLLVSLIIGLEFAKSLSLTQNIPLIPVNHMAGHLYSALSNPLQQPKFPLLSLIVSGGHTMLVLMKSEQSYQVLGSTIDDAAGEAFDKVARLLALPYPGGPQISSLAQQGKFDYQLPRPLLKEPHYNFSFSGLKTAVLYAWQKIQNPTQADRANMALSFETAAVDVLIQKTMRAAKEFKCQSVSLGGGVAANTKLRSDLARACSAAKVDFFPASQELCTDNAQMIALAAYFKLRGKEKLPHPLHVAANPVWEL